MSVSDSGFTLTHTHTHTIYEDSMLSGVSALETMVPIWSPHFLQGATPNLLLSGVLPAQTLNPGCHHH